jgi:CRP/FNR family transcriptional regulator
MARRDIASHLRLATETVSRVLARFQDAGMITVNRKNIVIDDFDALESAAHASNE